MPLKAKVYKSNFLREETTPDFSTYFKQVLFNHHLSYGCRAWLLYLTTLRRNKFTTDRAMAKKLKADNKDIARWRKETKKIGFSVSFDPLL